MNDWAKNQEDRHGVWRETYELLFSYRKGVGCHCVFPLLGMRCRRYNTLRVECRGCLPSTIGDHGRSYHRRGDRHPTLFLGQPYNPLDKEGNDLLERIRAMGLYVHIGAYGEGWYNTGTFPIVISSFSIPSHGFRCSPYADD